MDLKQFSELPTPEMCVEATGGDARKAEMLCWEVWEKQGKPHRDGHALMAIAIAELKYAGSGKGGDIHERHRAETMARLDPGAKDRVH